MAQQREYYNAVDWLKSAVGIATAEVVAIRFKVHLAKVSFQNVCGETTTKPGRIRGKVTRCSARAELLVLRRQKTLNELPQTLPLDALKA
jgi:hypothetical protein